MVDYVLTVAVSLSAGCRQPRQCLPRHRPPPPAGLPDRSGPPDSPSNLFGIAESARVLMLPTTVFVVSILGVIVLGLLNWHPDTKIGTPINTHATEARRRDPCAQGVRRRLLGGDRRRGHRQRASHPSARPRVRRAQRTEVSLGVLLGVMLIGLAVLIHVHHVLPRTRGHPSRPAHGRRFRKRAGPSTSATWR